MFTVDVKQQQQTTTVSQREGVVGGAMVLGKLPVPGRPTILIPGNSSCLVVAPGLNYYWGWSGGAKVLGKLSVLGRPTDLDYSWARAYCACGRCGWGMFGHFFSHLSLLFSFSLSRGPDID